MEEKKQSEKRNRIFVTSGSELVFPPSNGVTKDFPASIRNRDGSVCTERPYFTRVTKNNTLQIIRK